MKKTEEEMQEIESETAPMLKKAERDINRKFSSALDAMTIGLSIATGLDSIAFPILSGTTAHELLGIPPKSNYEIYSGMTALIAEQAIFFLSMFYNTARAFYKKD